MSVLYVALPVALLLGGGGLLACLWCIRRGQFDDLETPQVRMLLDDVEAKPTASSQTVTLSTPSGMPDADENAPKVSDTRSQDDGRERTG